MDKNAGWWTRIQTTFCKAISTDNRLFYTKGIKIYLTNVENNAHNADELALNKYSTAMNICINEVANKSKGKFNY